MEHILRFDKPAQHYCQALPVGNGRLGAMLYGGKVHDRVLLNEMTMWSGGPYEDNRPDAHLYLDELRRLLLEERFAEADKLFYEHFACAGVGSGQGSGANVPYGCYQMLGYLELYYFQSISHTPTAFREDLPTAGTVFCENAHGYSRALDLSTGVASTEFDIYGTRYRRELFIPRQGNCVAYRITSNERGTISLNAQLNRPEHFCTTAEGQDSLLMTGQLTNGDKGGIQYACLLKAVTIGGSCNTEGSVLSVRDADEVVLYLTMATDMQSFAGRNSTDVRSAVYEDMSEAIRQDWKTLYSEHLAAFRALYDRVSLTLSGTENTTPLPQRLLDFRAGAADPGLYELFFHYGRYLLISCNCVGGLPANMQGIWAGEIQTPWNGDWHIDAQQMIFWPCEVCALPETHLPLMDLICYLGEKGQATAQAYYGARGWTAHTIVNPWGFTAPGEGVNWGPSSGCAAWLCEHAWQHYLFTGDRKALEQVFPALRGLTLFYQDMLTTDPSTGYLVTAPGISPENFFVTKDGYRGSMCAGPTFDQQTVRYLFRAFVEACVILETDAPLAQEINELLPRLAPTSIDSKGQIMEYLKEYEQPYPYHRHISHLWGLYPGDEITPEQTPVLAEAAGRTLDARGRYASAGWANMHRANLYARLKNGARALELLDIQLRFNSFDNLFCKTCHLEETNPAPTLPDFDNQDFPFQLDANMGGTACIAELLLQSHVHVFDQGKRIHELQLLPALPAAWKTGEVCGLIGRGAAVVDLTWADGKLTSARITAQQTGSWDVSYGGQKRRITLAAGEQAELTAIL